MFNEHSTSTQRGVYANCNVSDEITWNRWNAQASALVRWFGLLGRDLPLQDFVPRILRLLLSKHLAGYTQIIT